MAEVRQRNVKEAANRMEVNRMDVNRMDASRADVYRMDVRAFIERFERYDDRIAFVWREESYSYRWLAQEVRSASNQLERLGIRRGVVSLEEEDSPYAAAALFALLQLGCIVLPIDRRLPNEKVRECLAVGEAQARVRAEERGISATPCGEGTVRHELLVSLLMEQAPGLVVFSSGSTGRSKAAVHRADRLLKKFERAGQANVTIAFMKFDHIGGLNTLLQTLANGGTLCFLNDRSPEEVCRTIERHRAEALPASPTFLNLLLLSEAWGRFDLSSLKVVSYGSEPMPPATLAAWNARFPGVRTVQAYGMSELGVLPTKSRGSDSLHFSLRGGEGAYRLVDGMLEIKSESAMVGYLNAPSPFTEDGWLRTGDEAVVEDGYLRILGRRSEMINVGGEKVYPAEVEGVLERIEGVEAVVVEGEPSGITGQLVKATVKLRPGAEMSLGELRRAIREFCADKLPPYKIPQKIALTTESLTGDRLKKVRHAAGAASVGAGIEDGSPLSAGTRACLGGCGGTRSGEVTCCGPQPITQSQSNDTR